MMEVPQMPESEEKLGLLRQIARSFISRAAMALWESAVESKDPQRISRAENQLRLTIELTDQPVHQTGQSKN